MKVVIVLFLIVISLSAKMISVEELNELSFIKNKSIKVNEIVDLGSIYFVQGTNKKRNRTSMISFSMTKDLKYLFLGRSFNTITGEKLYIKKDMSLYTSKASFTYGIGKNEYYIFTDPQCPYCNKFEKRLLKLKIQDKVKIHYFLYPLRFHKNAKSMSMYILSQKDNSSKLKALHNIIINGSKNYKSKVYTKKELVELEKELKIIKSITLEVGINGTPTIFTKDGKRVKIDDFFKEVIK